MTKSVLFFLSCLLFFASVSGQTVQQDESLKKRIDLGVGGQIYPAGLITTVNAELFQSPAASFLFRLGGNFANRKDFSRFNDNEKGNGYGGSIGYRRHFYQKNKNIVVGLHLDVWNLWIDWKNNIDKVNKTSGQSYTLVLQPWLEAGYFLPFANTPLKAGLTAGFGREINAVTDGKEVGHGWMASLLFHLQYSIPR